MSFVTRNGAGVGEGEGSGVGLGDGPCAKADAMFSCGVANAAAPRAGTSFTKARRFRSLLSFLFNDFSTRFFPDLSLCIWLPRYRALFLECGPALVGRDLSRPGVSGVTWEARRQAAADESGDRSPHSKTRASPSLGYPQAQPRSRISSLSASLARRCKQSGCIGCHILFPE